jgi:hypothetical protein
MPTDEPAEPDEAVHQINRMVSGASGDVVQTRDVHGGVHFHRSESASLCLSLEAGRVLDRKWGSAF